MAKRFNYTYWRSRLKIDIVSKLPVDGLWLTVSDAAIFLDISRTTVRYRYLSKQLSVITYKNVIHVNVLSNNLNRVKNSNKL